MLDPVEPASQAEPDDPETRAMIRRLQSRLFDMPAAPVRISHFELLRVLGSGGMGVVHLGRDELLDRLVAIKLIRSERTQSETRNRLLREAQAMARVTHPNVVQVYEAGEHEGRVFVAMELVEGPTLRAWIDGEGQTKPWRERLRVLRAAGRGLAAAHRAGVIHRDFKPENVLIDATGEPKVGDFGLAGLEQSSVPTLDDTAVGPLTQTGAMMGTPLYMAPEQLEAGTVDARSDQFAFCVVAYELLVGQRPFAGATLVELSERVTIGAVRPVPRGCPVPRWLMRVILRGLAVDPTQRWPSMDALLAAMAPRRRRRTLLAAMSVAGLAVALGLAWAWPSSSPSTETGSQCERGRSELADAWGPARREATEQAFRASGLSYADDTFARLAVALDAYASEWADGYFRACSQAKAGQPDDTRMACLERAHRELQLVTDELVAAQPDAIRHAADLVLALPKLERCEDSATAMLDVGSIADPKVRALVEQIDRATMLSTSGRLSDAEALLQQLAAEAQALQRDPLVARIGVLRSTAVVSRGELDDAKRFAHEALAAAERAKHDELELHAWRRLAEVSRRTGELERAAFELERAEAIAKRPTIAAEHRADLQFDRGDLLKLQNNFEDAVAAYEAAQAAYEALDPAHPKIATVLSDMAFALLGLGKQDAALAASERALAFHEQRLGPQHPTLVLSLASVSDQYASAGRTSDAMALRRRALAILEQADENYPYQVMLAAINAGDLVVLRRFDEAERAIEYAARVASEHLPADHPALAVLGNVRGNFEMDRRHYDAAVPHFEQALALTGPGINSLVFLNNLAFALARAGRIDEALTRAQEAREAMASLAPDAPPRVAFEITLADVDRLAGRRAEAHARFTGALERAERVEISKDMRLLALFGLARVEPDRARARAHALEAQALAAELPGFEPEREEIAKWLAEHP